MRQLGFTFLFFLCSWVAVMGQTQMDYWIYFQDSVKIDSLLVPSIKDQDSLIELRLKQYQTDGYLFAEITDIATVEGKSYVEINKGKKYYFDRSGNQISISSVIDSLEELQYQAIISGHPFARINVNQYTINDSIVSADFYQDTVNFVPIIEIIIDGTTRVTPQYFLNLTELEIGQAFSARKLQYAEEKIEETSFLKLHRTVVDFDESGAIISFYLDRQGVSNFDFLLGLISSDQGESYDIIGNIKLLLANQLGKGENFLLKFDKLQNQNQKLFVSFELPFIGDFPLGPEGFLDINQQDSIRTRTRFGGGLRYGISKNWTITALITKENFSLTTLDLDFIQANQKLPTDLDYSLVNYSTKAQANYLDYSYNPRKGWSAISSISAGQRKILENSSIFELDWSKDSISALYDEKSPELQLEANLNSRLFIPVLSRSTFMLGLNGGYKYSENDLLVNQMYRLGGFTSLRGFNEETIFATRFLHSVGEFRLLLDKNSNLYFFGEYAWLYNPFRDDNPKFQTAAGGFGLNFETKIGTFGIAFANGVFSGTQINFRDSKVHFGLQSRF